MCSAYDLVRSFLYFVLWCDVFSLWFWSVPFCDVTSFNIRFIWFLLWCDGEWLVQTLICSLFLSMSVMWGSFRIKLVFFWSVQFNSRWYLCARKSPYALHSVSQKFPQRFLWNGFNVRLIDDGPLSSFQERSSSTSSFHASLLQVIDVVMSLALCPQVMSQVPQHFRSSEKQATCGGCFAASLSARSFPFTPACPGQYSCTHRSFWRWMLTVDTFQSGLPIPLFTFCC